MPDPNDLKKASPHKVNWLWRLLGLYQKQSHPFPLEMDDPGTEAGNIADWWARTFRLAGDRRERYRVFDEMDTFDLVSAVLDVFAEETTQPDYDRGRTIWIESSNQKMIDAGDECLRNTQAEDRITPLCRRVIKMGDGFQRVLYATGKGVLGWRYAPSYKVHRLDDKYGRLIGFREDGKSFRHKKRPVSWPWDYIHFRLLGRDEETGYGSSILEPLFRPWRQLTLSEDAMLMYRLRRAPDRNLILVDVGDMEEHDAMAWVNAWRKKFRKDEFIDPASPNYKKQYNPLNPMEDIFFPVRGGDNNTRLESLSGSANVGEIYDVEHFRRKFFGTSKVPQAYMGFEGDINAKATLLQQDIRFARSGKRIRKMNIYGLRQLLDMHYTLLPTDPGVNPWDFTQKGNEYIVQMSPIAYLDEFERLELIQLRYQIIEAMSRLAQDMQLDTKVWSLYILLNYAKLPEDLVMKLTAKTPPGPQPPGGAEGGLESLPPLARQAIMDLPPAQRNKIMEECNRHNIWETSSNPGFYQLSDKEKLKIAEAIHESPGLRKIIGDIHEIAIEDLWEQQTDPSLIPVTVKGVLMEDTFEDDKEAKLLQEDLREIGLLTEEAK